MSERAPFVRRSADARRDEIVEAARSLFAQNGYHATTTRQLARAVGVSDALLYRHFASKSEVLREVVDRAIAVFDSLPPLERMRDTPTPALLEALGRGFLERVRANLDLIAILIGNDLGREDPRFAQFIERSAAALGEELARRHPPLEPGEGYLMARTFFGSLMAFVITQDLLGLGGTHAIDADSYLRHLVPTVTGRLPPC